MMARPKGCSPNTASPSRSNTFSWGSSSYIAISSRITARSESISRRAGRNTMSAITSNASGMCSSITRAYTEVVSLPVPAFSSAPMPSKIWSISSDWYFSEPLNSRCSRRCDRPASSSDSERDPVPIQNPSDTDRTEGIASVTILTPESSVVSLCRWSTSRLGARALAVNLDHAHVELVTLVEDLLDRGDPPARGDVRNVQQPVGALGQFDERAERGGLDDLAGELVADLDFLGHRADPIHQRVAALAVGRVDEHHALVVDVDLGLELLLQRADRLPALADEQPDLLRVDLDRRDARRVLRQLRAWGVDDLVHLAQDERPGRLRLRERVTHDVEGDAGDLDVHLERGDAVIRAGHLEVHVAEMVLDAGDVGEDDVVVTLLDQPHCDAGHGSGERYAGVHQAERRTAHARHRGRPVRLEDVRDDADRG